MCEKQTWSGAATVEHAALITIHQERKGRPGLAH